MKLTVLGKPWHPQQQRLRHLRLRLWEGVEVRPQEVAEVHPQEGAEVHPQEGAEVHP
jgi:hypothetical protein